MPRKAYITDLGAASKQPCFENISEVRPGADDGEFVFLYHPLGGQTSEAVQISALVVPDLSEYPSHHDYHIFANEDAPASVASALQKAPSFSGRQLSDFLAKLSAYLNTRTGLRSIDENSNAEIQDSQFDDALEDSDIDAVDNHDWVLEEDEFMYSHGANMGDSKQASRRINTGARGRADLIALKKAGFKVGFLGDLESCSSCFLNVACRIQKLGISEEAMEAWHLDPSEYILLLIHYPQGYEPLDSFDSMDAATARTRLDMRVGVCSTYRVANLIEAKRCFFNHTSDTMHDSEPTTTAPAEAGKEQSGLREMFISRPLNDLVNERLLTILKYRLAFCLSWSSAEKLYDKTMGKAGLCSDFIDELDPFEETPPSLPDIAISDEISTHENQKELSLPLLAMQFLLRHFVRCTEFCLVCHRQLHEQVEAIKPYVCDNPLCLYQYMSLGFGPSIEHEVINQPFVVDLLVSFCYSAVAVHNLHQFPEGLGLRVPHPVVSLEYQTSQHYPTFEPSSQLAGLPPAKKMKIDTEETVPVTHKCFLNKDSNELLFDLDAYPRCPIQKGDWILIFSKAMKLNWHCRVSETVLFPSVTLRPPIALERAAMPAETGSIVSSSSPWTPVSLTVYKENFDRLGKREMCDTIRMLLDLLPSVSEMRQFLLSTPGASLSKWMDRFSPAALGLLRWIFASNRSCIMQVDHPRESSGAKGIQRTEDRVQGIPSWLQFRFAMGAPDKEQRFLNALANRRGSAFRSIFAWHGSPLRNWHSIIREGLHFNHTAHGRAYGHGCYHATDFGTSSGYAGMNRASNSSIPQLGMWPRSDLQISSAVALSEIVNAPNEFVCQSPFYVVSQLDWIQTRYLFVQPGAKNIVIEDDKPLVNILNQDPARTPTGPNRTPIVLPVTAVANSRRPSPLNNTSKSEEQPYFSSGRLQRLKSKLLRSQNGDPEPQGTTNNDCDDDTASVNTQPDDLEILFEPEHLDALPLLPAAQPQPKPLSPVAVTDFVLRTLTNVPLMPNPLYATPSASKRLLKDFRSLQLTQASYIKNGLLRDLGWYADPEHMLRTDNIYQWIVELHSFPLSLPLAADMKKMGTQSIVLEIRFHATYPFSPPFVRIVRPRFLPFQNGGGGHVTAGGSICMDLLTSSGWTAVSDIESVLLQIRVAIMSTDPRPARLQSTGAKSDFQGNDYGVGEAVDAFKRAARAHGWVVPESLDEVVFATSATE